MYAFSHTDYIDPHVHYAARLRFWYAVRDAFGLRDVVEDSKATLHSTVNYRTYEPVEGGMHVGVGRDRRIRAGLRYAKGGAQKYWLPMLEDDDAVASTATGPLAAVQRRWDEYQGYAPVPAEEAADVVHEGFTEPDPNASMPVMDSFTPGYNATDEDDLDLRFSSPNENGNQAVEAAYEDSRKLVFGDYNYPVVDVSTEAARIQMWEEEERILSNARSAVGNWRASMAYKGYGATDSGPGPSSNVHVQRDRKNGKGPESLPHPAILDYAAETVPDIDVNSIRLKWTKYGAPVPTASSPATTGVPSPPAARRSTQPNSKQTVQISTRASKPDPRREDPPQPEHVSDPDESDKNPSVDGRGDAVDLVVEDRQAGELEMEWERRRGEPALAGASGLKKVFRRKYNVGDVDGDGREATVEIDEARHVGEHPGELPDKVRMKLKDASASASGKGKGLEFPAGMGDSATSGGLSPWAAPVRTDEDLFSPGRDTEVVISKQTAPPPHAVLEVKETSRTTYPVGRGGGVHLLGEDSEDERNPWS